ncbi:MAG: TonB-dependent receptor, partial [Kiritimatiellia bacterium]|nr:TonB-dependent receptor [Kiritimatiellia bacterium]
PGDYSGGVVNIETVGIPDEAFLKLSFSREVDSLTTGRTDFMGYEGRPIDPWGRHRGARDMPEGASTMEEDGLFSRLDSNHQYPAGESHPHSAPYRTHDRLTRSFDPTMGTRRERAGPNWSAGVSGGDRGKIGDGVWGLVGAFHYGHKFQATRSEDLRMDVPPRNSPQESSTKFQREVGTEEVKYSLMASAGLGDGEDQEVTVLGLRNRVATDRAARRQTVFDPAVDDQKWMEQSIHYSERSLDALQMQGRHILLQPQDSLFGLKVDWFAARNVTEQEEPDVRFFKNVVYRHSDGTWMHTPRPPNFSGASQDDSTRIWRNTQEKNSQLGLNVELPFERGVADLHGRFHGENENKATAEGRLKFGLSRDWTRREYTQNSFYYAFAGQKDPLYLGPVRSDYPAGSAGRRAFDAARAAWLTGPDGALYSRAQADAALDRKKGYYNTATPDPLWTDVFTSDDRIGAGPYQDSMYWQVLPRFKDISYSGVQNFHAGYAMLELPLTRQLALTFGSRAEYTEMKVEPRSDVDSIDPYRAYLVPDRIPITNSASGQVIYQYGIKGVPREEATAEILDSRWLPSMSLVYALAPSMKLRGSWSRTIARPTFLEIAPIITYDYIENETFIGNRELRLTEVTNYDLRWEWIRPDGEVYALSWFRKDLQDPIEKESFSYLSQDYLLASNYPEGSVTGIEAEFRRKLDFLPWPGENLTLSLNYTRIEAQVSVPEQMQISLADYGIEREKRNMEGQPEYLFNAGLMWDYGRTSAGLFYNLRGDTLKSGAAIGDTGATPDIYLARQKSLNLTLSHKITPAFTIGLKVSNLSKEDVIEVYRMKGVPDEVRRRYPEGVKTSFSVSCAF